jgi:hypothetical protein
MHQDDRNGGARVVDGDLSGLDEERSLTLPFDASDGSLSERYQWPLIGNDAAGRAAPI